MSSQTIAERLKYLRGELRAQRMSYYELVELQSLAGHIEAGDVELLEAAGVPENAQKCVRCGQYVHEEDGILVDATGGDVCCADGDDGEHSTLQPGDEVHWNDPDEGRCSRTLRILSVIYKGPVICITDTDGNYLECLKSELS